MPPEPTILDADQRRDLHCRLVEERNRVAGQLASLERTFDELVAAADLEPPDDEHDPDGTTAYERAQVASLAKEARVRLVELDQALVAVAHDPDFGTCTTCGRPIGLERLQAVPATDRCVTCASRSLGGRLGP